MRNLTPFLDKAISQRPANHLGDPRRMGVEIEFVGVEPSDIADTVKSELGGSILWVSPFEIKVVDTKLGTFKVELDSQGVKKIGEKSSIDGDPADAKPGLERAYIETVSALASNLVPWEIVTPPIQLKDLPRLFPLIDSLRTRGAQGTKAAAHHAFGVHLNPELPDLNATTILNYLKSFFCLYDWIKLQEQPDIARRITPFINHFSDRYVLKVLKHDYQPTTDELISDYLKANATRNRSLDMLPLFSHINQDLVDAHIDDQRINSRPTFHYRLPNSEIAQPDWNLDKSIETWMAVESLAFNNELQRVCEEYSATLSRPLPLVGSDWAEKTSNIVSGIRRSLGS